MKRKIIKYIKFLVSMVLILGLIAPSYASLSASDGSAFVTKAEFDSALADFNSRLTSFEAGINSKIDSQVTSYLDRNGIWNGLSINYEMSAGGVAWGSNEIIDSKAKWMNEQIPKQNIHSFTNLKVTGLAQGTEFVMYEESDLICKSLPKTGMLIGTVKGGALTDDATHIDMNYSAAVNGYYPWLSPIENLFFETKSPGTDEKMVQFTLGIINVQHGWTTGAVSGAKFTMRPYIALVPQAKEVVALFFVKKGQELYLRNKLSMLPYGGTIASQLDLTASVTGSHPGIGWNIVNFQIY